MITNRKDEPEARVRLDGEVIETAIRWDDGKREGKQPDETGWVEYEGEGLDGQKRIRTRFGKVTVSTRSARRKPL